MYNRELFPRNLRVYVDESYLWEKASELNPVFDNVLKMRFIVMQITEKYRNQAGAPHL